MSSTRPESDYSDEKAIEYLTRAKEADTKGDKQSMENMKREYNLLNRMFGVVGQITNIWEWCMANPNKPFPEWRKEDVEYYRERVAASDDLLDRARYAYAVWTFTKEPKFAELFLRDFFEAGKLYYSRQWYKQDSYYVTMAFCFEFAARLSTSLGEETPVKIISIMKELEHTIEEMHANHEKGRGISDLVDLASRLSQDLRGRSRFRADPDLIAIFSRLLRMSNELAEEWYKEEGPGHWYESYLENVTLVTRFSNPSDAKTARLRIAESFLDQARKRSDSEIARSVFLEKALRIYHEEGEAEKAKEVQNLIRESATLAVKKGEFKEITSGILNIPVPKLAASTVRLYAGKTPEEILERVAKNSSRFPDKTKVREFVEQLRKEYPLTFVFPRVIYDRNIPQRTLSEEKENFDAELARQYSLQAQVSDFMQAGIMKELFSTLLDKDDLTNCLSASKVINENSKKIIFQGLDHHFRKEYFGSVHILVPQIEEIIRTFLILKNQSTTKYSHSDQGMQEKLLVGLIDELEGLVDPNFVEYLGVRLTPKASNIRNKVCHGWMEAEAFDETLSWTIIDIILRLSRLLI